MEIRGDEGDGCKVVGGSVIPFIPPHLPISLFLHLHQRARKASARALKSRQESKILADSSTTCYFGPAAMLSSVFRASSASGKFAFNSSAWVSNGRASSARPAWTYAFPRW